MDYFYDDQLRWNFGFDNPNHAAALVASLLPFLWLLGHLWTPSRPIVRQLWWLISGLILLSGWYLLGLTVSRSGLLAAASGFLWIGWRAFPLWKRHLLRAFLVSLACLGVVLATGALSRTMETAVAPDASATNRLTLWKGGLEMLAIAPQGVGQGASGTFFMNWLQPVEADAGYRTMVNSYLTFFTEYGLLFGALALFLAGAFVLILQPRSGPSHRVRNTVIACQASLMAFAVAGFFSTTMETVAVWLGPILSGILLASLTLTHGRASFLSIRRATGLAAFLALGTVGLLWAIGGIVLAGEDRKLTFKNGTVMIVSDENAPARILVVPDVAIMGTNYGKSLRRLSETCAIVVPLQGKIPAEAFADWVVAAGETAETLPEANNLILLAPIRLPEETTPSLLTKSGKILVFLPGFDEDGRVAYWQEQARLHPDAIEVIPLPNFGNDLTQAWPEILARLRIAINPDSAPDPPPFKAVLLSPGNNAQGQISEDTQTPTP